MGYIPKKQVDGCFGTVIFMGFACLSFMQLLIGVIMYLVSLKMHSLYEPSLVVLKIAVPSFLVSLLLLESSSSDIADDKFGTGMVSLMIKDSWIKFKSYFCVMYQQLLKGKQ